jgi:hypothetical protein
MDPNERVPAFGISFSLDAVNQLLFSAWGAGGLGRKLPDVATLTGIELDPALPPVVTATDEGTARVALGEIIVKGLLGGTPIQAAVSVLQDIAPSSENNALVLTPSGEPAISITWLQAEDVADSVRSIIAIAAKEQLVKMLRPVNIPFPGIKLDGLGKGFAGEALAMQDPKTAVDRGAARLGISGRMALLKK